MVVVGSLLPWRRTASGSMSGWGTAHLLLGVGQTFRNGPLELVAALWYVLLPVAFVVALAIAADLGRTTRALARGLSGVALLLVGLMYAALRSHPIGTSALSGPLLTSAALLLLFAYSWMPRASARP